MEEQVLTMLRDQVGTIMLGTVFLFVGLVACGISAIRNRREDRILVWFGLLNVMWGARILAYAPAVWKQTVEILTDVKALAHELYSPRLEHLDIAAVMSSFCKEFGERKGVGIDFGSDGLPSAIPPEISLCLFRVLQEALRNAVQHSGVRQVDARLSGTWNQIQLRVSDLGVGLNLGTAMEVGGLGFNRMQERLKLVKGRLSIESRPKRGTTIWAWVPLSLGSDSMR